MANGGRMPAGKLFVGFDLGNDNHAVCAVSSGGDMVFEETVRNDWGAIEALRRAMQKTGTLGAEDVCIAVEDRNCALVDALLAHRFNVFTINPKQVDRFRDRISMGGAKDDRRDARVLATTLRTDGAAYRAVTVLDELAISLRAVETTIDWVGEDFRRAANQLRAMVLRCWPSLLSLCPGTDEAWFWELVAKVMGEPIDDAGLTALLKRHRKRKTTVKDVRAVLDRPRLPVCEAVVASTAREVGRQIQRLELLKAQHMSAEKERLQLLERLHGTEQVPSDVDILLSAPGCGPKTTAALVTTVLPTLKAPGGLGLVRALCGVAPVTKRSGKSSLTAMRHACSAQLREAMHHAAAAAARWDPKFKAHYGRLRASGHNHARALRGIADRLLSLLSAMLRTRTLYRAPTSTA